MPAESWLPASEGPMVSTLVVNFSGRAPYFRELASELASVSLNDPVIWALPSRIGSLWPALDSRNFFPLSSQVISGWEELSATGAAFLPFAGQVNAANFLSHSSPGFWDQATGLVTGAPL